MIKKGNRGTYILNRIDDLVTSLDNMHNRSESQKKKAEWVIKAIAVLLSAITFLIGGEVLIVILNLLIFNRISKLLLHGEMPFAVRWLKMVLQSMILLIISLVIVNVLEYFIPEISTIFNYSLKKS